MLTIISDESSTIHVWQGPKNESCHDKEGTSYFWWSLIFYCNLLLFPLNIAKGLKPICLNSPLSESSYRPILHSPYSFISTRRAGPNFITPRCNTPKSVIEVFIFSESWLSIKFLELLFSVSFGPVVKEIVKH